MASTESFILMFWIFRFTLKNYQNYAQLTGPFIIIKLEWEYNRDRKYVKLAKQSIKDCQWHHRVVVRTGAMGAWHPWNFEILYKQDLLKPVVPVDWNCKRVPWYIDTDWISLNIDWCNCTHRTLLTSQLLLHACYVFDSWLVFIYERSKDSVIILAHGISFLSDFGSLWWDSMSNVS